MPLRRLAAILSLYAAALVVNPAALFAANQSGTARFAISVAGIPAGELTLSHRVEGDRYAAASEMRTTGLVSVVARLGFDGSVTGRVAEGGRLEPERYSAFSRSMRSERDTEIVFEDGDPVAVSVVPPRSRQVDVTAQAGTLDPVSAAVAILRDDAPGQVCNDLVQLFDGSRRSELRVGPPEPGEQALVCHGTYTRLEGEAHSVSDDETWPFRLVFVPNGNGTMTLHRIETPTRFGRAVMERRG